MKSEIFNKIGKLSDENYIFWITLLFYLILTVINPPNKLIVVSFIFLFMAFYWKMRKIETSLLFTYIASSIILTGKTYPIQLTAPGILNSEIYPNGYIITLIISSSTFIAFAMLLYMIRQAVTKRRIFNINTFDVLVIVFYVLRLLSALIGSKMPSLSLPFEILSLGGPVIYFFARFLIKPNGAFWKKLSSLLAALIIFESLLGFYQLAIKSPIGKNIEFQVNIEYFGNSPDETQFTFRPVGTFMHANALGIWAATICLFLFIACIKYNSAFLWISFFLGTVLITTTISRSAWLGYAVGLIFLIISLSKKFPNLIRPIVGFVKKRLGIIIATLLILLFFFIIPRAESSIYSFGNNSGASYFRSIQNRDAIELIKLHPLFGVGAAMAVFEGISLNLYTLNLALPLEVHNWYLNTALTNGLSALFVILLLLILYVRGVFDLKKNYLIKLGVVVVIFCSLVAGIFQPFFSTETILLLISLTISDSIKSV